MSGTIFRATAGPSLLDILAAEQAIEPEGRRNTELFRRARVALEAGFEPDEMREALFEAGVACGLERRNVDSTLDSALRAPRERTPNGVSPIPPGEWRAVWSATWPRVIGVDAAKRPMQRWQYPWDEPNDEIRKGTYFSVVIPPGLAVLDVDDADEFATTGLDVPDAAPRYQSISGKEGKGHVWFRLHPDRPYPTRTMRAWPGADLLVGGTGIANIRDLGYLETIGRPDGLPLAPDWMQPAAPEVGDDDFPYVSTLIDAWNPADDVFTVDRMLRPGYRTLIAAYESTGKTYLAMQLALHLAYPERTGAAFAEFAVNEALTVLYVDAEVGEGEALNRTGSRGDRTDWVSSGLGGRL